MLARGPRRCPACGVEQDGSGRACAACGADLTARHAKPRNWRRLALVALVVAVVAAVSYPLVSALRDDAAGERELAAERQERLEAAERARLTRDSRPVRAVGPASAAGADPLERRAALVADAESRIAEDARGRVAAGSIRGDIKGAECFPFPGTQDRRDAEAASATRIARYDCVAYTSRFAAPERDGQQSRTGLFGFPYWLVVEYPTAKLVWCKVTPGSGEGGGSLAVVPVPEPCRDPAGPG